MIDDHERRYIEAKLDHLSEDIKEIKGTMQGNYVTVEAFAPVRALVYGVAGIMLIAVTVALVALVVVK